ncbi:hemerythrin domain-containing protein [Geomonas agri]|uniref:hypothetical protein n=1 Tax=Geomonas agri TaxID=2873702 RepID=UPI001CD524C5|nr:hypothetical protein [Geomonas agri]
MASRIGGQMVTVSVNEQDWPQRQDLECGHDSRYVKVVAVLDRLLTDTDHGQMQKVGKGLQHLLANTLDLAESENRAMREIGYPEWVEHEQDHHLLCTTIASLCWRWSRSRHSLDALRELRDLVLRHLSTHDHSFEQYLRGNGTASGRRLRGAMASCVVISAPA